MTRYRLIGTGTTDSNGIAHITKDAEGQTLATPGYTGVGAGMVEIVASTDSTITSTSLVTDTYTIEDLLFYDEAVEGEGHHRTDWTGTDITVTYSANGTTLTTADADTQKTYNANYSMSDECVIEFDITKHQTGNIRFYAKGYDFYLTNTRAPVDTEVHVKGIFTNGLVTYYIDDVEIGTNETTSATTVYIRVFGSGVTFRNFKIYAY